jgi:hypothetical protein
MRNSVEPYTGWKLNSNYSCHENNEFIEDYKKDIYKYKVYI